MPSSRIPLPVLRNYSQPTSIALILSGKITLTSDRRQGKTNPPRFLRKGDYDGYLCVPFFPDHLRNTQYALRAFNVELASIRENVSKPEIGKMRMQFWKDTIDKVYAVK